MKIKMLFVLMLSLAMIISLAACGGNGNGNFGSSGPESEPQIEQAPDFTVYDKDGRAHKLSDFRGKPVVLNFWASWCPPCRGEMPEFDKVYADMGDRVHFLMVNLTDGVTETVEDASAFIAENGYCFPVYYDTTGQAAGLYGVSSIPTTFFIDADGCAVSYAVGAISESALLDAIEDIAE